MPDLLTHPFPPEIWDTVLPVAQALILAHIAKLERIVALEAEVKELKVLLDQNSGNSHMPPSSDPPSVTKPLKPPSHAWASGWWSAVAARRTRL